MIDDNIIPASIRDKMVKEAKRIENDTFFSAKGHFVAADEWRKRMIALGIPSTVFSAIAGVSALAQFDNHNIVAALSALTTFLNPGEKANSHQNAGTRYTAVRNDARKFYDLDSFRDDMSDQDLLTLLEDLRKQRNELNQNSLPIPRSAYRKVCQQYQSRRSPTA